MKESGVNQRLSPMESMDKKTNPATTHKTWWRGAFFVETAREEALRNGGLLNVAYAAVLDNFLERFPDVEDLGAGAMRSTVETYLIIKIVYPNAIVDIGRD